MKWRKELEEYLLYVCKCHKTHTKENSEGKKKWRFGWMNLLGLSLGITTKPKKALLTRCELLSTPFFPLKIPMLVRICINNCLLPFKKNNCLLVETKVIIIKRRGWEDNLFCEWSLPNLLGKTNFKFVSLLSKCKIYKHVRIVWVLELWKLGIKLSARYSSYQTTTLLLKHLPIWWWISWLCVELINSLPI